MPQPLMLDAGVLGGLAHPRPRAALTQWFDRTLLAGAEIILPEIADYEVRRSLILTKLTRSVERLDQLKVVLIYQPIDTDVMLKAAELWAMVRQQGHPTADPKALDGDVILAAQALQSNAIVITENIGHLSLFVPVRRWQDDSDT